MTPEEYKPVRTHLAGLSIDKLRALSLKIESRIPSQTNKANLEIAKTHALTAKSVRDNLVSWVAIHKDVCKKLLYDFGTEFDRHKSNFGIELDEIVEQAEFYPKSNRLCDNVMFKTLLNQRNMGILNFCRYRVRIMESFLEGIEKLNQPVRIGRKTLKPTEFGLTIGHKIGEFEGMHLSKMHFSGYTTIHVNYVYISRYYSNSYLQTPRNEKPWSLRVLETNGDIRCRKRDLTNP
jgi:hypothetical protein